MVYFIWTRTGFPDREQTNGDIPLGDRDEHHFAKHDNVSVGLISAAEGLFSLVSIVVHRHPGVVDRHEVAVLACRQV